MSNLCATVNRILPFSCVDGPGNRLVIFLQGCNFRCLNCHNPYTIGLCDHCAACVTTCPHDALRIQQGKVIWHQTICQHCDTCLTTCSRSASPMTLRYSVSQMLTIIRKYAPFLTGITISGGEATLQTPFITELFQQIRLTRDLSHLTCLVDSNGHLAETGWRKLIPVMDGAMIDLKAWDSNVHQRLTGRDNRRVITSLVLLAEAKKLHEVRLLIIPNHTDLIENIAPLAKFLKSLSPHLRIRINAFQHHGVKGQARHWRVAHKNEIEQFADKLISFGFTNIIKPGLYLPEMI